MHRRACGRRFLLLFRLVVDLARHCLQHLARVLEVAAPENGNVFAGKTICVAGHHLVIADHDALRRLVAAFRSPAGGAVFAIFFPVKEVADGRCWCCSIAWCVERTGVSRQLMS